LPIVPILANFFYRSAGQAKAGNYGEILRLLRILLRLDRGAPPGDKTG
jgi:hypothetical protein